MVIEFDSIDDNCSAITMPRHIRDEQDNTTSRGSKTKKSCSKKSSSKKSVKKLLEPEGLHHSERTKHTAEQCQVGSEHSQQLQQQQLQVVFPRQPFPQVPEQEASTPPMPSAPPTTTAHVIRRRTISPTTAFHDTATTSYTKRYRSGGWSARTGSTRFGRTRNNRTNNKCPLVLLLVQEQPATSKATPKRMRSPRTRHLIHRHCHHHHHRRHHHHNQHLHNQHLHNQHLHNRPNPNHPLHLPKRSSIKSNDDNSNTNNNNC